MDRVGASGLPAHLLHLALETFQTGNPGGELRQLLDLVHHIEQRSLHHSEGKVGLNKTAVVNLPGEIRNSHHQIREEVTGISN